MVMAKLFVKGTINLEDWSRELSYGKDTFLVETQINGNGSQRINSNGRTLDLQKSTLICTLKWALQKVATQYLFLCRHFFIYQDRLS